MLLLEIDGTEVLAFCRPPGAGPGAGGYLGAIGPGGSFKGLGHEALLRLGPGWHDVSLVETAPSRGGMGSPDRDEDDGLFRELRRALFRYEVGACTASEVCGAASRARTPGNRARVAKLLDSDRWRRLDDGARSAHAAG